MWSEAIWRYGLRRQPALAQFDEELLATPDEGAARSGRSRSDLIGKAIERYLAEDLSTRLDAAVVAGHQRVPQEPDRQRR
ncbi:MAG TPA: CopG family transcriptional regulator [Acidimicrobiales bacterium]|nr:CopG family transcriptional regulator [Acidimicrobiales bacterium]